VLRWPEQDSGGGACDTESLLSHLGKSGRIMTSEESSTPKSSARRRADAIKDYRCKNLIAVIENPDEMRNIGTVIRNVNALGVEKAYVIDPRRTLPDDWQDMRERKSLSKTSVSAIKWSFVKRFDSTADCIAHLQKKGFISVVTSPHIKGRKNGILEEVDYTVYTKLAVWFGNEGSGISDLAVEHSEMCIGIPMFGMIESLNLGTSSGIVLYEITKQRRDYQSTYERSKKRRPKSNINEA
jgi:tRNA (guanosine-2'-O-)-methyltransferase